MKVKYIIISVLMIFATVCISNAATINLAWEQDCVAGCAGPPASGAVLGWRVYMGDATGTYDPTPIINMPYDGTPAPEYTSSYVLTLTGAGSKFFVVTSYNATAESGYSNEVEYIYNVASPNVPVTLRFTITP